MPRHAHEDVEQRVEDVARATAGGAAVEQLREDGLGVLGRVLRAGVAGVMRRRGCGRAGGGDADGVVEERVQQRFEGLVVVVVVIVARE